MREPRLSLELLCGSSGVSPEHDGYFDPSVDEVHPGQAAVAEWAKEHGIRASVTPSFQDGDWYSDGYLYFEPKDIKSVALALREIGHRGDILDIRGRLTPAEEEHVRKVAQAAGWTVSN